MVNIKKDKKGKYYFTASLGFDPVTGKRVQKMRSGFKTKKEAQQAYDEIISNYGKNSYSSNSTMLFEEFFLTIFLPYYKGRVKERTYKNRLSTIKKEFAHFSKLSLSDIKPVHIQKWQNSLSDRYENIYVRNIYGLFQMALDRAVILGMIPKNPAKIVGNVKKEVDYWTMEEFEKVISTFYLEDYYQNFGFICLWLLFMTGLRVEEATALQWSDIDFENKKRQDKQGGIDFILSYNSVPTQKYTLRHIIRRHVDIAEVHNIRIHGLRHSHASLLISMGMNALLVKDRLGHEDIQTTLGTYGHLYPNTNFTVAESSNNYIKIDLPEESLVKDVKNQCKK